MRVSGVKIPTALAYRLSGPVLLGNALPAASYAPFLPVGFSSKFWPYNSGSLNTSEALVGS
jgi:hypothetical protein